MIKKRKRGFSLIELLVVISLTGILMTGGFSFVKGVVEKQNINGAKEELMTYLKLARNMAVTRQRPNGVSGEIPYVSVTIDSQGRVNIYSGTNPEWSYQRAEMADKLVRIVKSNGGDTIRFMPYTGNLVGSTGVPLGVGQSVVVWIQSANDSLSETRSILVNSSGVVENVDIAMAVTPTLGVTPTATIAPTPTPTTPVPTPVPTEFHSCLPLGLLCTVNSECCSDYCRLGKCSELVLPKTTPVLPTSSF